MDFRNVLVFSDGHERSERALRVGVQVARQAGGRLEILHVGSRRGAVDPLLGEALDALEIESLERLRAQAAQQGVEARAEARNGHAFVEIIRKARLGGFDLVVKAARGRERSGWPLFGSTAQHLVRKCPVPVWLVGERHEAPPRRVLAMLGGGTVGDARVSLDRRVIDVACGLADLADADVHVAAEWVAPRAGLLRGRVGAEEISAWVDGERRAAEHALAQALDGFASRVNPAHVELVNGTAERDLVDLASRVADLVVIGTSPSEGSGGLLIREEAEDVINRLEGSVVAVKPEGFVSPVG